VEVIFPRIHCRLLTLLMQDITSGKYQVVISSLEAYKDANKLRPALPSPELAHKQHIKDDYYSIHLGNWRSNLRY
jgi:hypothetical protein